MINEPKLLQCPSCKGFDVHYYPGSLSCHDCSIGTTFDGFVSKWISIKDRLPEIYQPILTYDRKGDIISSERTEDYKGTPQFDNDDEVTHWMPLPDPPIESENQNSLK